MVEIIENAIQLAMTGICSCAALYRAVRYRDRAWALLGLFAGIYCLGDLYWMLYLALYGITPQHFSVAEMSWYASYLFLMLLIIYVRVDICGHRMPETGGRTQWARVVSPVLWIVPVFTVGMCIFFMQWGDYVSNIITAVLMTGIMWHALSGLLYRGAEKKPGPASQQLLFVVTLVFAVIEYALWISSCFWMGNTIGNVYFWLDILLSCTFLMFVPALRKAVGR
jgi:hypothetical protein